MAASRRRINIELLLGISATFLSLAALVVSIFQTRIARDQQRASVWPYLQIVSGHVDDDFVISVSNNGVGPALIKRITYSYRGVSYPELVDMFMVVEKSIKSDSLRRKGGRLFADLLRGSVLKSGDQLDLYTLKHNETKAQLFENTVSDSSFHIRVVFSDVYNNCWQLDRNKVTQLRTCPE